MFFIAQCLEHLVYLPSIFKTEDEYLENGSTIPCLRSYDKLFAIAVTFEDEEVIRRNAFQCNFLIRWAEVVVVAGFAKALFVGFLQEDVGDTYNGNFIHVRIGRVGDERE